MGATPAGGPSDTIRDGIDHAVKVLVIDDQPLLRDVLAEFLELLGHEADQAAFSASGRVGLAYILRMASLLPGYKVGRASMGSSGS